MTRLDAQIENAAGDGIYIRADYDADFIADFKRQVPMSERSWDPDGRRWWISDKFAKRAIRVASGYFNLELEYVD